MRSLPVDPYNLFLPLIESTLQPIAGRFDNHSHPKNYQNRLYQGDMPAGRKLHVG
jgi:hypothetical protein